MYYSQVNKHFSVERVSSPLSFHHSAPEEVFNVQVLKFLTAEFATENNSLNSETTLESWLLGWDCTVTFSYKNVVIVSERVNVIVFITLSVVGAVSVTK